MGLKPPHDARRRWPRRLVAGFFLLNLLAVTWPGVSLFAEPEPLVLGLPLSMAWPVAWIILGWLVLLVLDHVEQGRTDDRARESREDDR